MPKKSPVWNLFEVIDSDKAKCTICYDTISTVGRSSSGILNHARRLHPKEFSRAFNEEDEAESLTAPTMTLLTLAIATGGVSFSFVENEFFKSFLQKMSLPTPSSDTVKRKIMGLANESKESLRKTLQNQKNISITYDGWSSPYSNFHAFALFVIYVDKMFRRCTMLVGSKGLMGSATSENVSTLLASMLEGVGLDFSKVAYSVTDNGSNLVKMNKTLDIPRLPCVCHIMSHFFEDIMKSPAISHVLWKAKKTSKLLGKSNLLKEKFKSFSKILKCDAPPPKSFSKTRWGGAFILLKQFLECTDVLQSIPELIMYVPSVEEKESGRDMVNIAEECFDTMTLLEGDNSTASSVAPHLNSLYKHLINHDLKSTRIGKMILAAFKKRCEPLMKSKDFLILSYLDPRFAYFDNSIYGATWANVEQQFLEKYDRPNATMIDQPSATTSKPEIPKKQPKLSAMARMMKPSDDESGSSMRSEVAKYRRNLSGNTGRPSPESDPIDYWRINHISFPILSALSREILAVPSSSAASERCFSKAANLLNNPKRNRMKEDTLDALLQVSARAHLISGDSKVFKYALDNSDDDSSDDESEKLEKPSTSYSILDSPPSKVSKDTRRRGRKRRSSKTDNIISKRVDYEFSNISDDENAPKCSSDARQEITYSDEDDIFIETKINTPIDDGSFEF